MRRTFAGLVVAALLGAPAFVSAQDDLGAPADTAADPALGAEGGGDLGADQASMESDPIGDDQALTEEAIGTEQVRDDTDPYEDPTQGYYFAGLFYRHTFVPSFLLNLFTAESSAAANPSFGAEFTYRKDGFDIVGSIWWASWSVNGPFRASGDPETDVEIIDSELSTLFLTGTFLWSTAFNDIFALEYGVGIGVGIVFGDMQRTEAYPTGDGNFAACNGERDPNPTYCDGPEIRGECEGDGGHYCTEPKWTGGGSVPNVVPWLAIPHLALRIKPIRQLMMRVEGGFGLGFFFGGSISYGF